VTGAVNRRNGARFFGRPAKFIAISHHVASFAAGRRSDARAEAARLNCCGVLRRSDMVINGNCSPINPYRRF
jgi:hypothetical protein